VGGHGEVDLVGGLEERLVPARERAPRVGVLELVVAIVWVVPAASVYVER